MTQRTKVAQMEVREAEMSQAAPEEEVWVTRILCALCMSLEARAEVSETQDSFSVYSSRPLFNHRPFCFRPAGGAQLWTPKPH